MKRLLIPTDFSDISKNSIVYGFQLAAKLNLEVFMLHVLDLYKFAAGISESEIISTILPADNIKELEASATDSFNKMLEEIKDELPAKVQYKIKVTSGNLANEIISESTIEDTEIMILAVSGNLDLISRFSHRTISAIIEEASCPVIIVPSGFSFKMAEKVVLATDFHRTDLEMIDRFISLFGKYNPLILVLHVATKTNDFKSELKFIGFKQMVQEKIAYANIEFKMIVHKNVVKGILETVNTESADALLMLKEHESFFKSLFETNKTEKITHFLKIPMISYHESVASKVKSVN
jgi:nucleotide-binding universal stress UspA family protein